MGALFFGGMLVVVLSLSAASVIATRLWLTLFGREAPPAAVILLAFVIAVALISALM
jgi:hypothetical protein